MFAQPRLVPWPSFVLPSLRSLWRGCLWSVDVFCNLEETYFPIWIYSLGVSKSLEAFVLAEILLIGRPQNYLVVGGNDQICSLHTPLSFSSLRILLMLFPISNPHVSHYRKTTSHLVITLSPLAILAHMKLHPLKVSSCLNHKIQHFITIPMFIIINCIIILFWIMFWFLFV